MNEDTGLKKSIGIVHSWRIFEFLFIRIHCEQRRSFSDCQFWNRYFLVLFLQTDFDVVAIKTRIHEFVSTRQMYISYRWIHHQTYTFKTLCNTNNIKLKKKILKYIISILSHEIKYLSNILNTIVLYLRSQCDSPVKVKDTCRLQDISG